MSEKKIKVGDRVRITSFCVKYEIEPIYGTVVSIEDYGIGVELDTPELLYLYARDIEVVPPIDPRTAFLQDLKRVLERHNAGIDVDFDDYGGKTLYFNVGGSEIELYRINSADANIAFPITADNITNRIKNE